MTKIVNYYQKPATGRQSSRQINLRIFNRCLFASLFILGFFYLLAISDLTVKGFALQGLKVESSRLARENVAQEEQANALQSYRYLNTRAEDLNMVAVGDIDYLIVSNTSVAKK